MLTYYTIAHNSGYKVTNLFPKYKINFVFFVLIEKLKSLLNPPRSSCLSLPALIELASSNELPSVMVIIYSFLISFVKIFMLFQGQR